jgi:hypothetical protein
MAVLSCDALQDAAGGRSHAHVDAGVSAAVRPAHQHLGRRQERATIKEASKSLGRWLSSPPFEHGEQPKHGGRFLDRDHVVAAVAGVPAERGPNLARTGFRPRLDEARRSGTGSVVRPRPSPPL